MFSAAVFKFMPRFKAQSEGSIVYYTHALVVESCKQRGNLIHMSMVCWRTRVPFPTRAAKVSCCLRPSRFPCSPPSARAQFPHSTVPDALSAVLPKCLQTGKTYEANMSPQVCPQRNAFLIQLLREKKERKKENPETRYTIAHISRSRRSW